MANNPFENNVFDLAENNVLDETFQVNATGYGEEEEPPAAVVVQGTEPWGEAAKPWATRVQSAGTNPDPKHAGKNHMLDGGYKSQLALESDILSKEKQLEFKEVELDRWEQQLKYSQSKGGDSSQVVQVRNWPSCLPILHYDLNEVAEDRRPMVRVAFVTFFMVVIALVYNSVAVSWFLVDDGIKGSLIWAWALAMVYMVLGIPGAWLLWMKPLYKAAVYNDGFHYIVFFVFNMLSVCFCAWSAIAPPIEIRAFRQQDAHAGFFTATELYDADEKVMALVFIVSSVWWSLTGLGGLYSQGKAFLVYRGIKPTPSGAEFQKDANKAAVADV